MGPEGTMWLDPLNSLGHFELRKYNNVARLYARSYELYDEISYEMCTMCRKVEIRGELCAGLLRISLKRKSIFSPM